MHHNPTNVSNWPWILRRSYVSLKLTKKMTISKYTNACVKSEFLSRTKMMAATTKALVNSSSSFSSFFFSFRIKLTFSNDHSAQTPQLAFINLTRKPEVIQFKDILQYKRPQRFFWLQSRVEGRAVLFTCRKCEPAVFF